MMAVIFNTGNIRQWLNSSWIVIVLLCIIHNGGSFNVDTVNFIRHRGEPGSMFGFSVAEHREYGKSWVLVGAPEARTRQPGVDNGGAVYKCETTSDDLCEQIPFDLSGNKNNSDGKQIDKKSHQWFGATVRSSGENGVVLACAPRYVWFTTTTAFRRDPVGTCYVAKNQFQDFWELSPCRTRNWGYHRQGSCQAGLGADVSKDGQRLYVGAPGSWYWQGQIYDISSSFKMPTISPDYSKTNDLNLIAYESGNKDGRNKSGTLSNKNNQHSGGGQLYAQNPNKIPEVWATSEGSPQDDDSYLGYSVVSGDFDGRGTGGVAVGMPRGANLLGKVVLYNQNLTNLQNITGHQLGAYFSYSIAAVDVDGDALDDLVIGAPLYTDLSNNEGKYETGRVYIYLNEPRYDAEGYFVRFSRYTFRDGTTSKSRFGLSVAALGDINRDGYGDFAVGAPYDGESNRGAVYIYHGMRKGVRETYSQVIKGEELSVPVTTFGFSISGGMDMDGNQYPDMVVGAYESDTAIFFRSRPVVKVVDSRVLFHAKNKQISLDDKPCTLRDFTPVSCTNLEICLKYSGPEVSDVLDFDIGIALDSKKTKNPRMFFLDDEGKFVKNDTIRLNKDHLDCKSYFIYIKPNIRDKLTPLEAELRYNVITRSASGSGRRYTRTLEPALDTTELNIRKDSISIQKNCGPDNVCIPDLRLTTKKSVSKYLLGSGEKFALDVMVENRGEDAFEAVYNLEVPLGMNFVNIERVDTDRSIPVQCSAPSIFTNNTLKCDIGNPLPKGKLVNFKVLLQPYHLEGMKPSYSFVSTVNSTNPEEEFTSSDNLQRFTVPIWVETDLILSGSSHPAEIHYNMSHYEGNITHESHIGPQVVHVYSIRNKGPADILEAQTIFLWPSYTLAGDHLLYLLEQPETSGNIKCEWVDNVNEERIELDRKRKSYLQSGQVAYAAQRVGADANYGKSTTSRKGKGKMTEEERKRLIAEGGIRRDGGDGSGVHRQRVDLHSSGSRRINGSSGGSGLTFSEDTGRTYSIGTMSSQGSGTDRVRYENRHSGRTHDGSAAGGSIHWREEAMQGRRVGSGGYRTESEDGYYYVDTRARDRNDDSDWGTPDEDAMRRAYGSNEFRTVTLDLNSNIPVLNIGSDKSSGEITGHEGSRTRVTSGGSSAGTSAQGSHSYAINVVGSEDRGGYHGGETRTVHVSEGGSSSSSNSFVASGGKAQEGTVATHMVHVAGGGSSGIVETHGSGSYGEERTGTRTQDGTLATHLLHVSGGTSGGKTQTAYVSQGGSRKYEVHGGSAAGYDEEERRRQEAAATTGGTRTETVHVSHGGSRTYQVHGGSTAGYDAEEERRSQEESGSRTQTVHVSQGGSRTYEVHGGSYDAEYERRRQEAEAARRQGATRTETVHTSQGGSRTHEVYGGSTAGYDAEERRRQEESGSRTQTVQVSHGGSRTYEVHGGSYDAEYERRRQEAEAARRQDGTRTETTVHTSQEGFRTYEVHGGAYDSDYERRRQEAAAAASGRTQGGTTRTQTMHVSGGGSTYEIHGEGSRGYDRDSYDREYERRRQEGEAASGVSRGTESTSHVSHTGSSRTYVTQGGTSTSYERGHTYDEEYERRLEAEAAAAEKEYAGATHLLDHSTDYTYYANRTTGRTYNGSRTEGWDSGRDREYERRVQEELGMRFRGKSDEELQEIIRRAGGGRIIDRGSLKWVFFDNGTIVQVGSSHDPEYERRVTEDLQRRLKQQLEREKEERMRTAGRGRTYEHGSSYDLEAERRRLEAASTGHMSEYQRRVEQDLKMRMRGKSLKELEEMIRNTSGRVVEGGSSRWVVFDNGTVVSVGETDNPEYEQRLREELLNRLRIQMERDRQARLHGTGSGRSEGRITHWYTYTNESTEYVHDPEYQRRLKEYWDKRAEEELARRGSSHEHYYDTSYSSESSYTRKGKRYDTHHDFLEDDPSSEKRTSRTRQRVQLNSLEDEESAKEAVKGGRSKREHLIPRFKRLVEEGMDLKSTLKCGPTDCTKIMCTVGPLARGQEAWVAFRGRLWAKTLKELGQDRVIRLSSLQASQLTKLPHIGEPESAKIETHEVFTEIMPQDTALRPEVAPLWIWVLSACAGTLILLLLIFLLWKLGFFKRNRPSTAPEKQPLNRNGYQAGDEAL